MKFRLLLFLLNVCIFSVFAENDSVIYSFRTENNKIVQLLYDEETNVFTFRFISDNRVELEISDDLNDDKVVFTVSGYHRGGGVANAAMDYNDVMFSHNEFYYDIYYVWAAPENETDIEHDPGYGIMIYRNGEVIADLKGVEVLAGEVYGWSFHDILPELKEH